MASTAHLDLLRAATRLEDGAHAADALRTWVHGASARDVMALAAVARASFSGSLWWDYVAMDVPIEPAQMRRITRHARVEAACILSLHRSGYVRESALELLAESTDAVVVPYLLLRADDIVAALREQAERSLLARLRPADSLAFARALPLVEALRSRIRGRRSAVAAKVDALLLAPSGHAALDEASTDRDPLVRQACLALRLRLGAPLVVLRQALADGDLRVRMWAARMAVAKHVAAAVRLALVPVLEASTSARTRALAVHARAQLDPNDEPLEASLLDPHALVRLVARTQLRARHPDRPFGAPRRRALAVLHDAGASVPALVGALGTLADVGTSEDLTAVSAFAAHPRARVRHEAERTRDHLRR